MGVDADTTDYWDSAGGVPAPHLLSTEHSASPYPQHETTPDSPYGSPRKSEAGFSYGYDRGEMQELHSAPTRILSSDTPAGFASPYPSNRHSYGGRQDTFLPTFDSRDTLYHTPTANRTSYYQPQMYDDHAGTESVDHHYGYGGGYSDDEDNDDDAWGLTKSPSAAYANLAEVGSEASLAQKRERYISRKQAALAASGSPFEYTSAAKPSRFNVTRKQKYWLIGTGSFGAAVVFAIIIFFATRNAVNSSLPSTSDSIMPGSNGKKTAGAVQSDSNDPSIFTKDDRLHQSMYGLCYTPFNAQYPGCGATQANVTEDIQLMSQLTKRLRLYGADCNTSQLVLEAIRETKVDMQVFLAVWVDDNADTFSRQVKEITDAITAYGTDHIAGVTVGNEYLLNGGSVTDLLARIQTVNTTIQALPNLGKVLPVGTADAGSMITTTLATGADYIMANVHPWFGGLPVDQAAGWVWEYTNTNAPSTALLAPNKPTLYVAEAGWPTGANSTAYMSYEGATAGVAELNEFLSTFVCQSNTNATSLGLQPSFVFEAFDEPWKDPLYGGVEAHWGLFTSDKKLKDGLTIPDCPAP